MGVRDETVDTEWSGKVSLTRLQACRYTGGRARGPRSSEEAGTVVGKGSGGEATKVGV